MKYAVIFEYANQDRIAEARPRHRAHLQDLQSRGKLAAAGPFTDDSGALIIYDADSEQEVESLIRADPFHEAGVFHRYTIRPWKWVL